MRTSVGFVVVTPVGINERQLAQAGFGPVRRHDATENTAAAARRWHDARAAHRDELPALEGAATYDGQQLFFRTTAELAEQRRLSRYAFHATVGASAG